MNTAELGHSPIVPPEDTGSHAANYTETGTEFSHPETTHVHPDPDASLNDRLPPLELAQESASENPDEGRIAEPEVAWEVANTEKPHREEMMKAIEAASALGLSEDKIANIQMKREAEIAKTTEQKEQEYRYAMELTQNLVAQALEVGQSSLFVQDAVLLNNMVASFMHMQSTGERNESPYRDLGIGSGWFQKVPGLKMRTYPRPDNATVVTFTYDPNYEAPKTTKY